MLAPPSASDYKTDSCRRYRLPISISKSDFVLSKDDPLKFENRDFFYTEHLLTDCSTAIFEVKQKIEGVNKFEADYRSTVVLVSMEGKNDKLTKEYIVTKLWRSVMPDISSHYIEDIRFNSITIVSSLDGDIISSLQFMNDNQYLFPITGEHEKTSYIEYVVSQTTVSSLLTHTFPVHNTYLLCSICYNNLPSDTYTQCPFCGALIFPDVEVEIDYNYYYQIMNGAIANFRSAIDAGIRQSVCRNPNYSQITTETCSRMSPSISGIAGWSSGFSITNSPSECYAFAQYNRTAFNICRSSLSVVLSDLTRIAKNVADELHSSHSNEVGGPGGGPGVGGSGGSGTTNPPTDPCSHDRCDDCGGYISQTRSSSLSTCVHYLCECSLNYWDRLGHDTIINKINSKLGLSKEEFEEIAKRLKKSSAEADGFLNGNQSNNKSHYHAMRRSGETVAEARQRTSEHVKSGFDDFVTNNISHADADAWTQLGYSIHAMTDSFSPAHKGFQLFSVISNEFYEKSILFPTPISDFFANAFLHMSQGGDNFNKNPTDYNNAVNCVGEVIGSLMNIKNSEDNNDTKKNKTQDIVNNWLDAYEKNL